MADQYYIEEGYVDSTYFEIIRDSGTITLSGVFTPIFTVDIADSTGYFIPDYIDADYFVLPVTEFDATLSAAFTITATAGELQYADSTLAVAASLNSSPVKTVDAVITMTGVFTPLIITGAIVGLDATTLSSAVSFAATANRVRDNDVALETIVTLNIQAAIVYDFASSLSSAFTQTSTANLTVTTDATLSSAFTVSCLPGKFQYADSSLTAQFTVFGTPRVLVRNTSVTNSNDSLITFDSGVKEFGTHSLKFTYSDTVHPSSKVIYTGSTYYVFDYGYTWTSSNGTSWTRTTNNLAVSLSGGLGAKLTYLDGKFIFRNGRYIYYSSNGTSWSTVDLGTQAGTNLGSSTVAYDGSNWWIGATNETFTQYRFYRSSTLQDGISNWTLDTFLNRIGTNTNTQIRDVAQNGTTIGWLLEEENGSNYVKQLKIGSSYYTIGTAAGDGYTFSGPIKPLSYVNGAWTFTSRTGLSSKVYSTTNGSSISSSTYSLDYTEFEWIDYFNSRYVVGLSRGIYTGTSISNLTEANTPPPIAPIGTYDLPGASDGTTYVFAENTIGRMLQTTDGSSFTVQGAVNDSTLYPYVSISRGDNGDFDSWKTIDFWYYQSSSNNLYLSQQTQPGSTYPNWQFTVSTGVFGYDYNGNTISTGSQLTADAWNHIRILNDSGLSVWLNGTRYVNQQTFSTTTSGNPIILSTTSYGIGRIDELLVSDEALSSHSDSTITVPTSAWANATNTDLLMHFDGDFTDDSRFSSTVDPEADITAQFNVTAEGGYGLGNLESTLSGTFSVYADADVQIGADATLASQASLTASYERLRDFDSNLSGAFSITADNSRVRYADSSLASEFSLSADVGEIVQFSATLPAVATTLAAVAKIGDYLVSVDVVASLDATPVRTASGVIALSSVASTSVSEQRIRGFEVDISGAASFTATANIEITIIANLSSAATLTVDNARTRETDVDVYSAFTLEADPAGTIIRTDAALSSAFSLSADVNEIIQLASALADAFSLSVDAIISVDAEADLSSAFSLSSIENRIRDFDADFDAVASTLVAAAKIGDYLVSVDVVATLTADGVIKTGSVVALNSAFTLEANINEIVQLASDLNSLFTMAVDGTSNITGEADLNVVASMVVDGYATIQGIATLSSAGGFTVTANAIRTDEVQLTSAFTLGCDVNRTRTTDSTLTSAFTAEITAGKTVEVGIALNTVVTIAVSGRIIIIDIIEYTIPAETREFTIDDENREYTVDTEIREYTIQGAE